MRNLATLFLIFLLLAPAAFAAESALYDFGSMQQGKMFSAEPGDTVNLSIFFFVDEVYGNRVTHVLLSTQIMPDGWSVEFDPPAHDEYLNVSGVLTTSHENLFVPPLPLLAEPPQVPAPGFDYLRSPSGKGYLQAKRVQAAVKIPSTAELGKSYTVKFIGEAFWFGQSGSIALKQSRPFEFQINTAKKAYTEQVVVAPASSNATAKGATPSAAGAAAEFPPYMYALGGLVLLAILAAAYRLGQKKSGGLAAPGRKSGRRR